MIDVAVVMIRDSVLITRDWITNDEMIEVFERFELDRCLPRHPNPYGPPGWRLEPLQPGRFTPAHIAFVGCRSFATLAQALEFKFTNETPELSFEIFECPHSTV